MTTLGQLCLLCALVASGYAAFACIAGSRAEHRLVARSGVWAGLVALLALTGAGGLLVWALLAKDFRLQYVVEYSDPLVPWYYCLSAMWVGQAGSLLLWAWLTGVIAAAYRFTARKELSDLREYAFGMLMACLCLLATVMVFAADPMQPSVVARAAGTGLAPSLRHPAMLLHPPIIFLGYAAWGVPFALGAAALVTGRLDSAWVKQARPWALVAWAVLGGGILIGADWAYEELGWGGYWSWDPIENGSLMPWLTGTAFIHCLMSWQYRGVLKKSTVLLAVTTFALCQFAAFLTRSGIFSSLHAFSQSSLGWIFLGWMSALLCGGIALVGWRWAALAAQNHLTSIWSRESLVLIAAVALILLAGVMFLGTLSVPLSGFLSTSRIAVGPALYNRVLMPIGLVLLATASAAPLLRWGGEPTNLEIKAIQLAGAAAVIALAAALAAGLRHFVALAMTGLVAFILVSTIAGLAADSHSQWSQTMKGPVPFSPTTAARWWGRKLGQSLAAFAARRRQYAGFLVHLGFASLAAGVVGSSLGSRDYQATMAVGDAIECLGRQVRCLGLVQRDLPEKSVVEARLEISENGAPQYELLPGRHLHRPQNESTSEVAIHSAWSCDFYAILEAGKEHEAVRLTFVENPMMRWLWLGGWIAATGVVIGLWPKRRTAHHQPTTAACGIPQPHLAAKSVAKRQTRRVP
jgi:cytochrome c-type biogenesis protein CcmF